MILASLEQLLTSEASIAIIRYIEWTSFSRTYNRRRYILLVFNSPQKDLIELKVPGTLPSFLVRQLPKFQQVIHTEEGSVWERHDFRERVKPRIPYGNIRELYTH